MIDENKLFALAYLAFLPASVIMYTFISYIALYIFLQVFINNVTVHKYRFVTGISE